MQKLPERNPNHSIRSDIKNAGVRACNKWLPKYVRAGKKVALIFGAQVAIVGVFAVDHQVLDDRLKKAVTPLVLELQNKLSGLKL